MSETEYSTIKLPTKFVEQMVDPFVKDDSYGFSSRPDVVKAAIREYAAKYPAALSAEISQ